MLKKIKYLLLIAIPGMVLVQAKDCPDGQALKDGKCVATTTANKGFQIPGAENPTTYGAANVGVKNFINNSLSFLFWSIGLISLVFFMIGAFTYITSQGNDEAVGKAKKTILYAVIGVVVALLAIVILRYLGPAIEGSTGGEIPSI